MAADWFNGSAPGRMDVMGGIADYSGSVVLQMPIKETTDVRVRLRNDYQCNLSSQVEGSLLKLSIDFRLLLNKGNVDYQFSRDLLSVDRHWASYVLGCVLVLIKEKQIDFRGADFEIESGVPLGKGVSSSASLEIATMRALAEAFQISFAGTEIARFAQHAENFVAGAPCGLMDQLASTFGEYRKLLPIRCQPDILLEEILIPDSIAFIGLDSGVRHAVGGSSYTDVRCAAFMGYTIIAKSLGVNVGHSLSSREKLPYGGYLCNIMPDEYEERFKKLLPETILGRDFLRDFGKTTDNATSVQPDANYQVRVCTEHPIFENERVQKFMRGLQQVEPDLKGLGRLMNESHESYSRCGLGSERTDEIVEMLKGKSGVYGSKITGGGSGGTVCALVRGEEGLQEMKRVKEMIQRKYDRSLYLFV